MEFNLSWLFWALPLAFAMGWLASRWDMRQWRWENRQAPHAYFRGLSLLLSEQQDQAVDAFVEAVQKDPDTIELHFALGSLFRRRGDYDRAIRLHEHLLARTDLPSAERERAQHELALDFWKAGLLDRTQAALKPLLQSPPFAQEAAQMLMLIHERSRDWPQALALLDEVTATPQAERAHRRAHYLCELAAQHPDKAADFIGQAQQSAPIAPRPALDMAQWLMTQQRPLDALHTLRNLLSKSVSHAGLAAPLLVKVAQALPAQHQEVVALLHDTQRQLLTPSLDVTLALAELDPTRNGETCLAHLQSQPSVTLAHRWLTHTLAGSDTAQTAEGDAHGLALQAVAKAAQPLQKYRCGVCGFEAKQYFWHCPGCLSWDSYPPKRIEELR